MNITKIVEPEISLPIKDRNLCITLLKKSKRDFYNGLNVKRTTENLSFIIYNNRRFWQTIKPSFTENTLKDERITLIDGDMIITEEKDVVKITEAVVQRCSVKYKFHKIQRKAPVPESGKEFSCEFCEILRTPFYIEHLWWLLLKKLKDHFVVALKIDCHISSDLRDDPVLNAIENFSEHILKKESC